MAYDSCALVSALERRFLFLLHPLKWFFNAAEVENMRPQQQDIDGSIVIEFHDETI